MRGKVGRGGGGAGARQGLSRLHFLHPAVPEKGPHVQVPQPVGHLRQRMGVGVVSVGARPDSERRPTHFNVINSSHPCLFPSLNVSPRTPRMFVIHFFMPTSQPSPVTGEGPCLVKVRWRVKDFPCLPPPPPTASYYKGGI